MEIQLLYFIEDGSDEKAEKTGVPIMPIINRKKQREEYEKRLAQEIQLKKKRELIQEKDKERLKKEQEPQDEWAITLEGALLYQPKDKSADFSLEYHQEKGCLLVQGEYDDSGIEKAFNRFSQLNKLKEGQDYSLSKTQNSLIIAIKKPEHFDHLIRFLQSGQVELHPQIRAAFQKLPRSNLSDSSKQLEGNENKGDEETPQSSSPFAIPNPFNMNLIKK